VPKPAQVRYQVAADESGSAEQKDAHGRISRRKDPEEVSFAFGKDDQLFAPKWAKKHNVSD